MSRLARSFGLLFLIFSILMVNSSYPSYAWLLFVLHFMQGHTTHTYAARFFDIRTLFLCLRFGSNSLFACFSCLYTHVYIPCACLLGPTPFLQLVVRLYTHVYIRLSVFWV